MLWWGTAHTGQGGSQALHSAVATHTHYYPSTTCHPLTLQPYHITNNSHLPLPYVFTSTKAFILYLFVSPQNLCQQILSCRVALWPRILLLITGFETNRCFEQWAKYVGSVCLILLVFAWQKNTQDCQQSPLCALCSIHHPVLVLQNTTVPPVVEP